ncbi:MAG: ATP-binding cassette domain-containing protein [Deltaproteobacteria bacterium]
MEDPEPVVLYEIARVRKSFEEADGEVLCGVDLTLHRGETLGIVGPSGAGKSVLLKCMVGLLPIDAGEIRFDGGSVPAMGLPELIHLRQRVGLLFQGAALFDSDTVEDNLEFGLREQFARTMSTPQRRARVHWALDAVGLRGTEASMPSDLSGGMRKRVGIARTIITQPEVVLFDEPTQGLDPPNAHRIADLIVHLREKLSITSVVVSHDLRTVFTVCDRIAMLVDGCVVEVGPPRSLAESKNAAVRDFIVGHPSEEPFDPAAWHAPEPWDGSGKK